MLGAIRSLAPPLESVVGWIGAHGGWFERGASALWILGALALALNLFAGGQLFGTCLARNPAPQSRSARPATRPRNADRPAQPASRRAERRRRRRRQSGRGGGATGRRQGSNPRSGSGLPRHEPGSGGNGAAVPGCARGTHRPWIRGSRPACVRRRQSRRAAAGRSHQSGSTRRKGSSEQARSGLSLSIPVGSSVRSEDPVRPAADSTNGCRSSLICPAGSGSTASGWSHGCSRQTDRRLNRAAPMPGVRTALSEPLSSSETALLTALAPLAAHSPRDAKRFINAYRLARCSGAPRPVVALMQAVALADDDVRTAMQDRIAGESGVLGDVDGPAALVSAVKSARAANNGAISIADARTAADVARRYALSL